MLTPPPALKFTGIEEIFLLPDVFFGDGGKSGGRDVNQSAGRRR
jgi:hypothetical protein